MTFRTLVIGCVLFSAPALAADGGAFDGGDDTPDASAGNGGSDQMTQEREPNPKLYTMLVGALRTLAAHDHQLVVPAFFWKLLALEGYRPMVDACVLCDREDELCAFDLDEGGLVCVDHRRGTALTMNISVRSHTNSGVDGVTFAPRLGSLMTHP